MPYKFIFQNILFKTQGHGTDSCMERFSILDPTIRFDTGTYKMEKELKYTGYRLFLKQIVRIFVFIAGISIFVNVLSSNQSTCRAMDFLGENEMRVLSEFQAFSDLFERIKNRPEFADIKIGNISIPKFEGEEIRQASVGAAVLVGGLSGATLGTAGGFAASGATSAAVIALGTASTGTAISTLSGAAATNATLAALGGGSLAAGGGGIALGSTILSAATLGVGLLVDGIIFSCTGSKLSDQADKAWEQMIDNEQKIKKICTYLFDLQRTAEKYNATLLRMRSLYQKQLDMMRKIIDSYHGEQINWQNLSAEEQLVIKNMVLIVGILYNMCKVQLVKKENNSEQNVINKPEINKAEKDDNDVMAQINNAA